MTTTHTSPASTVPTAPAVPTAYDLYRLAEQHLADGHPRHAVWTLERLDADDLAAPQAQRLLALALYRFAALGRAREVAQGLVDADPSDAEAAHLLGRTLMRQGEPEQARRWLRLAAALDPREEHLAYADGTVRLEDRPD
jgi:Flp pilus assembly protein TadD